MKKIIAVLILLFATASLSVADDANKSNTMPTGRKVLNPESRPEFQYAMKFQSHLLENWSLRPDRDYPEDLKTIVVIKVRRDGMVVGREILKLSGDKDFDLQSLKAISKAAPFPSFPEELKAKQLELELFLTPKAGGI